MHVALTEILQCPSCGSGLVLLADRQEESRAVEGTLGCPSCSARYPVRGGVADLRERGPEDTSPAGDAPVPPGSEARGAPKAAAPATRRDAAADPSQDAIRIAALLGLEGARGVVVLVGRQARNAGGVGALVAGVEVATVGAGHVDPAPGGQRVSALLTGGRLPFADRRVAGVALDADAHVPLAEAVRILGPGRRLVLERASGDAGAQLDSLGCAVLARQDDVVVAERTGRPDPPRLYQLG